MKKTKTTEITVERDEIFVVRKAAGPVGGWCEACGGEALFALPEAAAASAGVGVRLIYRLVETGKVHFTETPDGSVLVCQNSLA